MSHTAKSRIYGAAFGLLMALLAGAIRYGLGGAQVGGRYGLMVIGMIVIGAASWGGTGWARTPAPHQEKKIE